MRKWIAPSIVIASIVITAIVFPRLPKTMATHWNIYGEIDGVSSRAWAASIMPLMIILMWAILRWVPAIDPRAANYAKFKGAFEGIIVLVMLFLFAVQIAILAAALGSPVDMARVTPATIGLLLIGVGNLLPRARSNWFVGIRTPWTLSSDRVWERTHRFGGYLLVAGGALILAVAAVIPQLAYPVMVGVCVAAGVTLVIYSFVLWRQENSGRDSGSEALPPPKPAG